MTISIAASGVTNRTGISSIPSIPALAPVTLYPRRASPCAAPLAFLESIDAIEINHAVERGGVVYFVLDVYLKPVTSRIPTTQLRQKQQRTYQQHGALSSAARATTLAIAEPSVTAAVTTTTTTRASTTTTQQQEPYARKSKADYQIEKRFSDFADLRYQVWVFAQRQAETRCALSNQLMDSIVHSFAQPRLLVRLATTTSMRKKLLATFCNDFLHIAVRGISSGGAVASSRRYPVDPAHTAMCE
ncbi:hypothetical protein PybrP1_006063, partial [[Pythium] brassicae (nom. inval.)]